MLIRYDSRAVLEHRPGNLFSPGVLFVRWISARVQPFPVTSQPLRGAATHPLSPVPQQNRPLPWGHFEGCSDSVSQTDRPSCVRLISVKSELNVWSQRFSYVAALLCFYKSSCLPIHQVIQFLINVCECYDKLNISHGRCVQNSSFFMSLIVTIKCSCEQNLCSLSIVKHIIFIHTSSDYSNICRLLHLPHWSDNTEKKCVSYKNVWIDRKKQTASEIKFCILIK